MGMVVACQVIDPGSIPGECIALFSVFFLQTAGFTLVVSTLLTAHSVVDGQGVSRGYLLSMNRESHGIMWHQQAFVVKWL